MKDRDFSLYELIEDENNVICKDKIKGHKRKRIFKKILKWIKFIILLLMYVYVYCGITYLVFSTFNCL